jgi:hypothetical protein
MLGARDTLVQYDWSTRACAQFAQLQFTAVIIINGGVNVVTHDGKSARDLGKVSVPVEDFVFV